MRLPLSMLLILVVGINSVYAQVLLKREPADPGHYIVAFNATVSGNKTAMRNADARHVYMRALKQQAEKNVNQLKKDLDATDLQVTSTMWLIQSAAIQISPRFLDQLEALPYVKGIRPDTKYKVQSQAGSNTYLSNGDLVTHDIAHIDVDTLWAEGYKGQGVVVAILDTGVYKNHESLAGKWRGGINSWYDPTDSGSTEPSDSSASGHGTGVTSIVLGGYNHAGVDYLGVAPDATYIAARVIGSGIVPQSDIHNVFQWLINPDGDISTDDYPDIVQNSWAFDTQTGLDVGCDANDAYPFKADLEQITNVFHIDVVFSVGNSDAGESSYYRPANDPSVISVGSIDSETDLISNQGSGQGPDNCNSVQIPSLVAPGVEIKMANSGAISSTQIDSGTSFSAPMVTGALALLRSKYKADDFMDYRRALFEKTSQIGAAALPNPVYGYGLVQASAAAAKLESYPNVVMVDNEVNFSFAALAPVETDSTVSVTLLRSGDVSGAATVRVTTASGTATQGLDFERFDNFVQFVAGETKKVIDITLIDDNESEGTEDFTVQFTSFTGTSSSKNSKITINIVDDEEPPTLDQVGGSSFTLRDICYLFVLLIGVVTFRRFSSGARI